MCILLIGGGLYCIIEILWRGYTHWTMAAAGGISLVFLYAIREKCPDVPLLVRCAAGAVTICAVEFAFGFAVNIVLGWNVWDYSARWMNIEGQICPLYAFLWFLLCIPGDFICVGIESLFGRKRAKAVDGEKTGAEA